MLDKKLDSIMNPYYKKKPSRQENTGFVSEVDDRSRLSLAEAEQTNKSINDLQQAIRDLKAEQYDTKKEIQAMPLQLGAIQKAKYDVEDLQKIFAT